MRKIIFTLTGLLLFCTVSAFAQQSKFGYINLQEVISMMPEMTEAQSQIQKINDDYSSMLEMMQVEFNNKLQDYQKNISSYSDAVKQVKERELQDLQSRMEELYNTARQELEMKSNELMAPIVEKAQNAVQKVGKDNGFTAIFDQSARPLAYYNESTMVDALPLVKKELGITDTPATAAATAPATK